jgi:hypothetical protein
MNTDNDEDVSSQNRSNLLDDVNLEESDDDDNLFT